MLKPGWIVFVSFRYFQDSRMKKNDFFSSIGRLALAMLVLWLAACTSNSPAPVVERGQQATPTQQAGPLTYTVKPGDTLSSIAREHGLDFRELIALNVNDIQNPDQLSVGHVLRVRSRSDSLGATDVAVTAPVTAGVVVARPIGETSGGAVSPGNAENLKREPKAGKEAYSEQALAAARSQEQPTSATEARSEPKPDEKPVVQTSVVAAGNDQGPWIWPANGKIVGTFSKESGSKGIDIAGKAGDPVIAAGDGKVSYVGAALRGYGNLVVIQHNTTYLSAYAHNRKILVEEKQLVTKGQKIAEMGSTDADQVKLHFEIRRLGEAIDPLKLLPPR
jgi:lipoprotein NlpD